jgi:acyl carrier protein
MSTLTDLKTILRKTLNLGARADDLVDSSRLLESLPELDSMAVVTVITAMEEHFGFKINDDEISAEIFQTLDSLRQFVDNKLR